MKEKWQILTGLFEYTSEMVHCGDWAVFIKICFLQFRLHVRVLLYVGPLDAN